MRIKIPATTANMGPGFDCLGMALGLYNYIDFNVLEENGAFQLTASGEDAHVVSLDETNLIYQSYCEVFRYLKIPVKGIQMHFENQIPFSRGLGSSSAAIIGGIKVANIVLNNPLDEGLMLKLAMKFENHPDNIAPALLGGIIISGVQEGAVYYRKITPPSNLFCTVIIPNYPLATQKAREVLPKKVSMQDAIFNIGRMGLFVDAMHTGDLSLLSLATEDKIHQPYRKELIIAMEELTQNAKMLGAINVMISGAGPTLMILSDGPKNFESLAQILKKYDVDCNIVAMKPVLDGAAVVRE